MKISTYILWIARFVLGAVFIVASIDKISAPDAFAASIHAYHIAPVFLENILALLIPWLELLCACCLLLGTRMRGSALIIIILLSIFSIAIVTALLEGLKIDCGCFGKEHATPVSWEKVLEDLGLIALGVYILIADAKRLVAQSNVPSEAT